jgi:hypothetical protein
MKALGRRDLLWAFLGFGAGVLIRAPKAARAVGGDSAALGEWLRGCGACRFADFAALRRLGALYLIARPEEGSGAQLSRLLLTRPEGSVASRLLSAISRDWSSHQVVVVDGWLLARTEARLCAFLHLEAEAGR